MITSSLGLQSIGKRLPTVFCGNFFSALKIELWDPVPGIAGTIPFPPDCFIIISSSVCLPTNVTCGARHRSESSLSPKCLAWCLIANIYWAPSVCQALLWGLAETAREKLLLSPREACAPPRHFPVSLLPKGSCSSLCSLWLVIYRERNHSERKYELSDENEIISGKRRIKLRAVSIMDL